MASRRIPLLSLEKPKTRNTHWRSSMNVMKPGVVCSQANLPPKLQPTICPCMSSALTIIIDNILISKNYSLNATIPNSIGYVSREDPVYANLPRDSRMAPASIDPSGKAFNQSCLFFLH